MNWNGFTKVVWEGSDSLGESSSLFTGTFTVNNYHPPEGFCFDVRCEDDPVIDDPTLKEYNIEEKVDCQRVLLIRSVGCISSSGQWVFGNREQLL